MTQVLACHQIEAAGVITGVQQVADHQIAALGVVAGVQQVTDNQIGVGCLPGVDCDPYWNNVVLAMHFDNDFVCEKGTVLTTTGFDPTFSADSAFGTHSLESGRGLEDYNSNYDWHTEGYTIECLIKEPASGNSIESTGNVPGLIGNRSPTTNGEYWAFGPLNTGEISFQYWTGVWQTVTTAASYGLTDWVHIAMSYDGLLIRIFVAGELAASAAVVGTPIFGSGFPFAIWGGGVVDPKMLVDDLRITKGVARYTSDFDAPTAAFPDVAC